VQRRQGIKYPFQLTMHLDFEGPVGSLEGLLDEPRGHVKTRSVTPHSAVVFAHPHPLQGGTMHTKVVFQGSKGLVRIGCAVLRFNFRGVGLSSGSFDDGRGEADDYRAALDAMHARYPGVPLWAAGFSFGAWIALETGAADPRVSVLIAVAPPVPRRAEGPAKPDPYTFAQTLESVKPKFFVQGDLDELSPLKDLWAFYARLKEPKELVVIDGANHLFDGKTEEVGDALETLLGDFE
jgi:alpha/beta superfamily hydrolase